jgi:Family of unknown function (DUF6069)
MEATVGRGAAGARDRRRARLTAVAAVVAAALGLWAVYHMAFGIDLRSPASFGESGSTFAVEPGQVALVSALAGFAAWGLLALLERLISRAQRVWLVIALLALVLSLGGPMSGTGLTTANRMELLGFHLLVGAVLIPLMYRTSPKVATPAKWRRDQLARTGQSDTREAAA